MGSGTVRQSKPFFRHLFLSDTGSQAAQDTDRLVESRPMYILSHLISVWHLLHHLGLLVVLLTLIWKLIFIFSIIMILGQEKTEFPSGVAVTGAGTCASHLAIFSKHLGPLVPWDERVCSPFIFPLECEVIWGGYVMVATGPSFVAEFLQVPTGSPGGHKSPCPVESDCTQGWGNFTYLVSVKSVSLEAAWTQALSSVFLSLRERNWLLSNLTSVYFRKYLA